MLSFNPLCLRDDRQILSIGFGAPACFRKNRAILNTVVAAYLTLDYVFVENPLALKQQPARGQARNQMTLTLAVSPLERG
jgi:hypothetical protein